jgi:hypothetical protein
MFVMSKTSQPAGDGQGLDEASQIDVKVSLEATDRAAASQERQFLS